MQSITQVASLFLALFSANCDGKSSTASESAGAPATLLFLVCPGWCSWPAHQDNATMLTIMCSIPHWHSSGHFWKLTSETEKHSIFLSFYQSRWIIIMIINQYNGARKKKIWGSRLWSASQGSGGLPENFRKFGKISEENCKNWIILAYFSKKKSPALNFRVRLDEKHNWFGKFWKFVMKIQ